MCPYQILSNYLKQYENYGLHNVLVSGQIMHNEDSESCVLALVLIYVSTKYYQNIYSKPLRSYAVHKMEILSGRLEKKKLSTSCSFCMRHSYLTSYMSLSNIIKLSKTVWELRPAQYFGFRGDKNRTKKVRFVSLTRYTPTSPPLHPYHIWSNLLKNKGNI